MSPAAPPRPRRSIGLVLAGTIAGAIAGGTVSALIVSRLKEKPVDSPVVAGGHDDEAPAAHKGNEMARMQAQIDKLGHVVGQEKGRALAQAAAAQAPEPPERTDKEIREEQVRDNEQRLAAHARETPDPAWAPKVAQRVTSALKGEQEAGKFKLVNVDCRTTRCVAQVEWGSRDEATENYTSVLHKSYGMRCQRSMYLPETEQSGPYRAQLVIECAENGPREEPPAE